MIGRRVSVGMFMSVPGPGWGILAWRAASTLRRMLGTGRGHVKQILRRFLLNSGSARGVHARLSRRPAWEWES